MSANPDVVDIHGTEYTMIAARLRMFREEHPDWTVMTEFTSDENDRVVVKATIANPEQHVIANGHAEEVRGSTNINSTSALENCETSAVGRALAFVSGEYAGNAIRSADEMADAIKQQNEKQLFAGFAKTTAANERNHPSLVAVRGFLAEENFDAARECWNEIEHDDQRAIWVATTKGGWLTTKERHQMKTWSREQ